MPENTLSRQAISLPRRDAPYLWLRAGFFYALGAALLGLLALVVWRLAAATLAVASPFVIAVVLALLLDPMAERLERRGMNRTVAAALIFGAFLLIFIALGIFIVPALIAQASQLAQDGPQYVERVRGAVNDFLTVHRRVGGYALPENFDALFSQFSDKAAATVRGSAGQVAGFLLGSISTALQVVVALIVTFYLLLDIGRLRARLFYLLPERARGPAGQIAGDIGGVFSDYLRGLSIVCALYGAIAMVLFFGLGFVHPQMRHYALLVGALAGALYAVPYIGALATALVAFLVAFAAGGATFGGVAVGLMLLLNQIFDNVVTPRVVGGGVGLHPVVAVFALVLGGELFSLWGLLLSVPVAASVQVVLFRVFPKLSTPTPPAFLRVQGIRPQDAESATILEGEDARESGDFHDGTEINDP
jgi:predicted PurR-regulated permease PerM